MAGVNAALTVLIVEDNEGDSVLAKIALAESEIDCEVHVAESIGAALESLQVLSADLVLLDMGLPDAVGLDGLHAIISHAPFAPVILLTGFGNQDTALQALEFGASDYLVKGEYTPSLLARAIRYSIERKKSELALLGAARFDAVTGLINRSYFYSLLEHALARAKRNSSQVHVLFLDLDHFKNINDHLGHAAGDALLREVGARIQGAVRNSDVVARLGGDEFTVIVEDADSASTSLVVANKILRAMQPSFHIAGVDVIMTPSVGIAGFPNAGDDAATLLQHADTAMYRAKAKGRNAVEFFSDEMNAAVREAFELEMSLRRALLAEEFELYYQPIIENPGGELRAAEALLRWHRDGRAEPVEPDEFIPMLESSGLIREVGVCVLRSACAQCRQWHDTVQAGLRVSVNISPRQIQAPGFVQVVEQALRDADLAAEYLIIEITERALLEGNEANLATLLALRQLGVAIAIDDFGSGYASLRYLTMFPFDTVKIDRSFVQEIAVHANRELITAGILCIAKGLGQTVVAEGVETQAQLDFLSEHDCHEIQGFFYSKPLTVGMFEQSYAQQAPKRSTAG